MKKIYSILSLLLICSVIGVSAILITTYFERQANIEVIQPISVEGNDINNLEGIVLDEYPKFIWGEIITISNSANKSIDVQIVSDNNESEIEVRYVGSEGPFPNGFDFIDGISNDIIKTIGSNSNLTFYPQYIISKPLASGDYSIITSVNPITI